METESLPQLKPPGVGRKAYPWSGLTKARNCSWRKWRAKKKMKCSEPKFEEGPTAFRVVGNPLKGAKSLWIESGAPFNPACEVWKGCGRKHGRATFSTRFSGPKWRVQSLPILVATYIPFTHIYWGLCLLSPCEGTPLKPRAQREPLGPRKARCLRGKCGARRLCQTLIAFDLNTTNAHAHNRQGHNTGQHTHTHN